MKQRYNDFNIPPLIQTLEEINDEFKTSIFLKAVESEKIIGSVRASLINSRTCYIRRLTSSRFPKSRHSHKINGRNRKNFQ